MFLITGGLGFIGSHTARALLDLGESCVLLQRRTSPELPSPLADEVGRRVFVERVDLADRSALVEVGDRHRITGVVHLAGSVPWPPHAQGAAQVPGPVEAAKSALDTLFHVVHAARVWGVPRVVAASTIGVYGGVAATGPLGEDLPLPMTAGHAIPAFKKIGELLADHLSGSTGVDIVNARIAAVWGPLGRPSSVFLPAPSLVHAAVHGTDPDLSGLYSPAHADDRHDMVYARDCGRALALLQLAGHLNHRTYNVGSGRATTNAQLLAALGAPFTLPPGRGTAPDVHLDIARLRHDTGYAPAYDTGRAVADYTAWLRAGNPR
jgi:UDP-glucose 4-epimerase